MLWSMMAKGIPSSCFFCKPWMGPFLLAHLQAQIIPPLFSRANHGTCRVSFRNDPSVITNPYITPQVNVQDNAYHWPISCFCGVRENPDVGNICELGIAADCVIMTHV